MSKSKILYIHHAAGWGGAPKSMIELIKSLDKNRYHAHVLLLKDSMVSEKLKEEGIEYSIAQSGFYKNHYHYFTHSEAGYIKWYQLYRFIKLSFLWLLSRYYFASKELQDIDYDIAHLNSSVLTDWLAPAKKKGKVIIHIREPFRRGNLDIIAPFFRRQMKKYADVIIAISKDNAKRVGLPEKTKVIYNYADVPDHVPPIESYSSKKILYLGGDAYIKGFYTLVDALDYIDKDIKIYFGGYYADGNSTAVGLKKKIKKALGFGKKRMQYLNKMRNHPNAVEIGLVHNVGEYLDEVCALISPFSVSHFARPVIESYLHKKPAIGSNVKGMEEIIKDGETGWIFERNNAKQLGELINRIVREPKQLKGKGEASYTLAINKYTPENVKQFQELYNALK